jgi:predicted GIY-YIG superfamily endonuclease
MKKYYVKNVDSKFNLYVLKLQNGKYYVGITTIIMRRKNDHINGRMSNTTVTENLPINSIYYMKLNTKSQKIAEIIEDYYTVLLIMKFGIKNVIGGHILGSLYYRKKIYESLLNQLIKQKKIKLNMDMTGRTISETFPELTLMFV